MKEDLPGYALMTAPPASRLVAHLAHKAQSCLCVYTITLYISSIFNFFLQFKPLEFWRRGEVRFVRHLWPSKGIRGISGIISPVYVLYPLIYSLFLFFSPIKTPGVLAEL